jgi:hypothetical protein
MVRSSSVFLFLTHYYRKECARMGAGKKIVCNLLMIKRKNRKAGLPGDSPRLPE